MLPFSAFVAFNVEAFGFFIGSILSWIGTCTGSFLCYLLFYYLGEKLSQWKIFSKFYQKVYALKKISFSQLVLIITLPFAPSCAINIVSGMMKVSRKMFLLSLLIGKMFTIIFWGYIGKSLFDSLTDIWSLLYISLTLVVAYIISKIIGKRMNLE